MIYESCALTRYRPAHAYTYPFEPNPDWSSFYAGSAEILQYFERFVDKYDLRQYIKINSKIVKAIWDDDKAICEYYLLDYRLKLS